MTPNIITHVIWDFPVMLFNIGRDKFRRHVAERDKEEGRWLNG